MQDVRDIKFDKYKLLLRGIKIENTAQLFFKK